jgi:non-specific serine/threonine protein kinase/protein-serine/threonine kinase
MATSLMGIEDNVDAAGENIHVQKLAELRAWAHPLQLPRDKVSYHLLESRNIAAAILEFARSNHAAHIVIGAPARGALLGNVSAQVTAEAPCTVTVVRVANEESRHGETNAPDGRSEA